MTTILWVWAIGATAMAVLYRRRWVRLRSFIRMTDPWRNEVTTHYDAPLHWFKSN